jgi:hypothetical protein
MDLMTSQCSKQWSDACDLYQENLNKSEQELFQKSLSFTQEKLPLNSYNSCHRTSGILPDQSRMTGINPIVVGDTEVVMPLSCPIQIREGYHNLPKEKPIFTPQPFMPSQEKPTIPPQPFMPGQPFMPIQEKPIMPPQPFIPGQEKPVIQPYHSVMFTPQPFLPSQQLPQQVQQPHQQVQQSHRQVQQSHQQVQQSHQQVQQIPMMQQPPRQAQQIPMMQQPPQQVQQLPMMQQPPQQVQQLPMMQQPPQQVQQLPMMQQPPRQLQQLPMMQLPRQVQQPQATVPPNPITDVIPVNPVGPPQPFYPFPQQEKRVSFSENNEVRTIEDNINSILTGNKEECHTTCSISKILQQ